MAEETPQPAEETTVVVERTPTWQRVAKWSAIALGSLVALLLAAVAILDTGVGHRFIADRLAGFTTASGLNVKVGRIEGSIYGAMVLRDVRVSDPKGVFATSPRIEVDWRPFAFLNNHVDIRSARSPLVRVARSGGWVRANSPISVSARATALCRCEAPPSPASTSRGRSRG